MSLLKLLLAAPACAAGLRLTSGGAAADYPWATTGGSNLRNGVAAYKAPRILNASRATWTFKEDPKVGKSKQFPDFAGLVRATPLVDDKANIYTSTVTSGMIYKLSPEGQQLWSHEAGARLPGTGSLMGGKLFAADAAGNVFNLDMETGAKGWSTKVSDEIADDAWSVTAGEGLVIVPALDGKRLAADAARENNQIVALDASTGEIVWRFDMEEEGKIVNALISIRSGSCVFSDNNGRVYRVDLKTGKPIWRNRAKKDGVVSVGQAVLDPEKDVVISTWNELGWEVNHVTMSGHVGGFDFKTGESLWVFVCQYPTNGPPAVGWFGHGTTKGRVIVLATGYPSQQPDPSMGVFANQGYEHQARITLLFADGKMAGTVRGWLTVPSWYGAAQGDDKRPDACMPKGAFSAPTFDANGNILVGYQDGRLLVVDDKDENGWMSSWEVSGPQLGAAFAAQPVVAPGMLIAAPCDGLHVWKFDAQSPPASM